MAELKIDAVSKRFGAFEAVAGISLEVAAGEFIAVLGPSGCGKTTLLRLVAGFERVTCGEISLGGRIVSSPDHHEAPERRKVGIVFQSYALWPHMSVAENVGCPLKIAHVPVAERRKRVLHALATVGLDGFDSRRPASLSGGQRQRVALARCLVAQPSLVLLDEPLANLDVHLRSAMEEEFARFHRNLGTTMFYITHDQAEAMALADRIAVMDHGRIVQLATPSILHSEPETPMVAEFIGDGMVVQTGPGVRNRDGTCEVDLYGTRVRARCKPGQPVDTDLLMHLRLDDVALAASGESAIASRISRITYRGGYRRLQVVPETNPTIALALDVRHAESFNVGDSVRVTVREGWIIPDARRTRNHSDTRAEATLI